MKCILSTTVLIFTSSASAFLQQPAQPRCRTSLNLDRGDSFKAIQEAVEASKTFGPQSNEARVAWDIVEEIRASDNSVAYKPGDESAKLDQDSLNSIKHEANVLPAKLKAIKLSRPENMREYKHTFNQKLRNALTKAEVATEWWGINSKQAKLAWEEVEDIASNDMAEAMKGEINTGEECLVEMMDACEAMEELERALFSNADSKIDQGSFQ